MRDVRIKKITLREVRTEDDVSILETIVDDDGNLILDGYDLGKTPQEFWGDSDYEYARVVKKKYKGRIMLLLAKERFDSKSAARKWLDEKGIPGKSMMKLDKSYGDTVILWLIKELFHTDTELKTWLDKNGIPSEFWSWV